MSNVEDRKRTEEIRGRSHIHRHTSSSHVGCCLTCSIRRKRVRREFGVANSFLNNRLTLVKCEQINAYAPADAELVLEGKLLTDKDVVEGPLVDITGTYDIQRKQPVIELVNMMHRRDYIYQALLPSGSEHKLLMGLPHETMIWEAVSKVVPKVKAVNLSTGGCGWFHAIVSIDKLADGDAKNALAATFSAHPSLKHAVVVDTDIDVYDPDMVEWAIATRFQAGVDATRPLTKAREKFERAIIPVSKKTAESIAEVKKRSERKKS